MRVSNLSHNKCNYRIGTLSKKQITSIAKAQGFEQRKSGSITANLLLITFINLLSTKGKSYSDLAQSLSLYIGKTISKQCIFSRMTAAWTATVKCILQKVISQQTQLQFKHSLYSCFTNVWLQDSTTFRLPDAFKDMFKGNHCKGKTKSIAN